MVKRIFVFVLLSFLNPWPVYGQQAKQGDVGKLSAEQIEAEIERLGKEIDAVRQSPEAPEEWKQKLQIEARLAAIHEQQQKQREPLAVQSVTLSQTAGVQAWTERVFQLEKRLQAYQTALYARLRVGARDLFAARHAELAKIAPADTPKLRELGLDVLSYPRMDGSTSTQPLATLIACRCLGASYAWVGREQALTRQNRLDPALPASDRALRMERIYRGSEAEFKLLEFTLRANTDSPANERLGTIINDMLATNASTHEAYMNLIEGRSDIGLLARGPSAGEVQLAREKGVPLEAQACARDAFVFLVNDKNSVKNLTSPQIQAIYSGQMRNWTSVGGSDQPIVAYQREENSGSQELMRGLVMKSVSLVDSSNAPIAIGMGGPFLTLSARENGIGYSVHYYEQFMSGSRRTKVIAVDGVVPGYESILEGRYLYVSDVLIVTRKSDDAQSPAKRLRDWLLSAEGQAVVRESGYVPVTIGVVR